MPFDGGANYMLTIFYDFSMRVWSFFLKHKIDVFAMFRSGRFFF